jgi:hypothetical protein
MRRSIAALVGLLLASLATQAAAAQSLTLSSRNGVRGSSITATYTTDATRCPDGTVHFWWDAPGPSNGNPDGAQKLGQAPLDGTCMAEVTDLHVPHTATCEAHTVYAFIATSNGTAQTGTTARVLFTVTGCPSRTDSPAPSSSASTPPTDASGRSRGDSGLSTAGIIGIVGALAALLASAALYLHRRSADS